MPLRLSSECGVAFVEFIICLPFLLILLVGVCDLGRALNTYFTVHRIAYEACRTAASTSQLEITGAPLSTDAAASPYPGHRLVRTRINVLFDRNASTVPPDIRPIDYLSTERIRFNDARLPGGTTRDQIRVRVRVFFNSLIPLIGNFLPEITAEVTGPYLFPN